jgi:hypothetical protein
MPRIMLQSNSGYNGPEARDMVLKIAFLAMA